jgi:hypothetical protein
MLSRTRNHLWVPNKLATRKNSTKDRLADVLKRSIIFGYSSLAYDADRTLILTEIKKDLEFEINDIRTSDIVNEGVYESETDGMTATIEEVSSVLAICDMMLGNTKSSLDLELSEFVKNPFELAIVEYYNMVYKKTEGQETVKSIDNVFIKCLKRCGLSVMMISQPGDVMRATVILDSGKCRNASVPNIADFVSCVIFTNASTDNYMAWLSTMCIEPDKNMQRGNSQLPFDFLNRWFSPMKIDEAITNLSRGCTVQESVKMTPHLPQVLAFLMQLHQKQGVKLGRCTYTVLKAALGASNYIDKHIAYALEILTSKTVQPDSTEEELGIDQEYIDAFKSSDLYIPELDITSESFIQVAAEGDTEEEPVEEEPLGDDAGGAEKDPVEGEEDPAEGDALEEDPIDDQTDETDPIEDGGNERTSVSKTDDKKGIELKVRKGDCTLDEYLYLREVGFILTKLLENPPEKMSAEKLSILKDIKTHWLHILDVQSLHDVLSKIINLKIKVKTEKVA